MSRAPQPRKIPVTRWTDPMTGERVHSETPGAVEQKTTTKTYFASIGGKRVSLGTSDLQQAWANLRAELRKVSDRKAGIRTPQVDAAEVPFADHVRDWLAAVGATGATKKHLDHLKAKVERLAKVAEWGSITDIDEDSCLVALAGLGVAAQTRNHYARAVKQFTRWLSRPKRARLALDPLADVRMRKVEHDLRHQRRLPTDEEISRLFSFLAGPPASRVSGRGGRLKKGEQGTVRTRAGMSGLQRALGYRVAMCAGLRVNELRSLTRASFDLDRGTVAVSASRDKRRRKPIQPLPGWLVDELRSWFEQGGGCWSTLPQDAWDVLRRDLEDAGVRYSVPGDDGQPTFFDFHALRIWYCTTIAGQPGAVPKVVMELCRHSTFDLTMRIYAKIRNGELKEAVAALPKLTVAQDSGCALGCANGRETNGRSASPGAKSTTEQPNGRQKRMRAQLSDLQAFRRHSGTKGD